MAPTGLHDVPPQGPIGYPDGDCCCCCCSTDVATGVEDGVAVAVAGGAG